LRIPRTRRRSFLPRCIAPLERRSPEVAELIRQAFLKDISMRQVGRVVAVVTRESVSAQTVSQLTRVMDRAVEAFHRRSLGDDWAYLFLDGVWLKVLRATEPQRVLLPVAYGVRRNGTRELLGFTRAKAESQAAWEGLLNDLFRRRLYEEFAAGDHRRLSWAGAGDRDRLSVCAAPALLGAQNEEYKR